MHQYMYMYTSIYFGVSMSRPVCISEIENGIGVSDLIMQMMMHVMGKLQGAGRGGRFLIQYRIVAQDS